MKILHVNFSDSEGGAAQAVLRFHLLLNNEEINTHLLVNEKKTNFINIIGPNKTLDIFKINLKRTISRNLKFFFKTENKNTHSINLIPSGIHNKINKINPDWVHLHWIGNEMISIKEISKIKSKIVWTMHDMWPFCGAEHYTLDNRYSEGYKKNNRPKYEKKFDLNKYVWGKKIKYFKNINKIICTSEWMFERVKKSVLFKDKDIKLIPLTIDQNFWKLQKKTSARSVFNLDENKKIICFGAENFFENKRKGFDLFSSAISSLNTNSEIQVVIFGDDKYYEPKNKNLKIINLGKIKDQYSLRAIFSASDIVVMPSRVESFGQIVLEALHCGTPCIISKNTAMSDMIKHKYNGYIFENENIIDLKEGIEWCIQNYDKFDRDKIYNDVSEKFYYKKIINDYIDFLKK